MTEPTQEQIKKFWEWCGVNPIGIKSELSTTLKYPDLDLNNLFKYAVPKWREEFMQRPSGMSEYESMLFLLMRWLTLSENELDATSLFWAIREVIKDGNTD